MEIVGFDNRIDYRVCICYDDSLIDIPLTAKCVPIDFTDGRSSNYNREGDFSMGAIYNAAYGVLAAAVISVIAILAIIGFVGHYVVLAVDEVVDTVVPGTPRADARHAQEEKARLVEQSWRDAELAQKRSLDRQAEKSKTVEQKREEQMLLVKTNFWHFLNIFDKTRSRLLDIPSQRPEAILTESAPYRATVRYGWDLELYFDSSDGVAWTISGGKGTIWTLDHCRNAAIQAANEAAGK